MSKYSTLLIPILNEILIDEIGESNIIPLKWTVFGSYQYFFNIDIEGENETVIVSFTQLTEDIEKQFHLPPKYRDLNNIFNIGYDISGIEKQFAKTSVKTLLTILSTIVDIIKDFIKHRSTLDGLFIQPIEKEIGNINPQKYHLYEAFIKKQLDQIPNYIYDTYRDGFILIKQIK